MTSAKLPAALLTVRCVNHRTHLVRIGLMTLILGFISFPPVNAAEANSSQANWESLEQLATGQQIRVVLNDAKSYRGQFQKVSDERLTIRTGGVQQTFERKTILRVASHGRRDRCRRCFPGIWPGEMRARILHQCCQCRVGRVCGRGNRNRPGSRVAHRRLARRLSCTIAGETWREL